MNTFRYACRSVIESASAGLETRPTDTARRFKASKATKTTPLMANIRPWIAAVKTSVPPSNAKEIVNSAAS